MLVNVFILIGHFSFLCTWKPCGLGGVDILYTLIEFCILFTSITTHGLPVNKVINISEVSLNISWLLNVISHSNFQWNIQRIYLYRMRTQTNVWVVYFHFSINSQARRFVLLTPKLMNDFSQSLVEWFPGNELP